MSSHTPLPGSPLLGRPKPGAKSQGAVVLTVWFFKAQGAKERTLLKRTLKKIRSMNSSGGGHNLKQDEEEKHLLKK